MNFKSLSILILVFTSSKLNTFNKRLMNIRLLLIYSLLVTLLSCNSDQDDIACDPEPNWIGIKLQDSLDNCLFGNVYIGPSFELYSSQDTSMTDWDDNTIQIGYWQLPPETIHYLKLSENVIDTLSVAWTSVPGDCGESYTLNSLIYNGKNIIEFENSTEIIIIK